MNDTAFLMNVQQKANSVPVHRRGDDGKWTVIGEILDQQPAWWSGGHGLYSTPRDYLRFQRMLLGNGVLEGSKVLERETVDAAFTNQIGKLDFPAEIPTADLTAAHTLDVGPGYKWGYGLLLNSQDVPCMRRAWSGAWGGMCNTYFWVDRTTGIAGSIHSQFLPFVHRAALNCTSISSRHCTLHCEPSRRYAYRGSPGASRCGDVGERVVKVLDLCVIWVSLP